MGASPITWLYELDDFEIARVVTVGVVAHNSLALAERSFAETLERTMRTRAGIIDDDVSIASVKIVNAFLADEDLHHLYKTTVWLVLPTAVLTESSIPGKIASCTPPLLEQRACDGEDQDATVKFRMRGAENGPSEAWMRQCASTSSL